ncbi:alpha/beta fold hydrolase [Paraburkholderia sp. ZP32-5]|uniref:alpha/beta fold hydrolase n=1 Tax=Paraburkholderia sp. ZP32-5 TaxID=2883245 RepID=UPI001F2CFA4A|nr:alpha/beta hydrolase [Paraburkholderia sp. ZP32-5]
MHRLQSMQAGTQGVDGFDPDFVATLPVQRLASGGALYVAGPAPVQLLFVHGGFHGAWCFGAWMDALSRSSIGCAAIDFAGHGFLAGEALPLSTSIADYATSVDEAVSLLGDGVCVVGHSLGALAVASAAARIDASAIVLLAPSPPSNLPGAMQVPSRAIHMPVPVPSLDEAIERFLGGVRPVWAERFHRLLCSESPTALNDRYELRVPVDPAALPSKTLVIAAGRDDVLRHPEGQDAAIAELYGAGYLMLDDAPHCMMLGDGSIAVLESILAWLTPAA